MTPTARTLAKLRGDGWTAQVVERFCSHSRRRIDLFQIIDVVAISRNQTLGIQTTTMSNRSSRLKKILSSDGARSWLASSGRKLELWCWRPLRKARGGAQMRWAVKIDGITADDLDFKQESPSVAGVAAGCGLHDDGLVAQAAADSGGAWPERATEGQRGRGGQIARPILSPADASAVLNVSDSLAAQGARNGC